jgi:glucose/arabinose dehydrogenase
MRLRLFLALLVIPLLLLAGLVLALRGGKSEVSERVAGDSGAGQAGQGGTAAGGNRSARAARGVRLVRIGTFQSPLYVTSPPGEVRRLFVVEQTGKIRVLVGGKRVKRPFLDLSPDIVSGGEQGLLSMAFAPDYARSRRFYVDFTDRNGDTRVQQFLRSKRNPNRADRSSRRQVLFVDQPYPNHNGGLLLFGPDRLLYVGLGDGGSAGDPNNRAQNLGSLLGKILRIDPKPEGGYDSPTSNPLAGRPGRDEIYTYGMRNPWRFSFDRKTGDLYIGDVGQNAYEEIDYASRDSARGRNYGWSCFEARHRYNPSRSCPAATPPVLEFGHDHGECSVTGGVVVRDPGLPALAGRYLYGDYCAGDIRSFRIEGGRATSDRSAGLHVASLSSFGEDARGRVYATSLDGPVYRLSAR